MKLFRHAKPAWTIWNVTKTMLVLATFWFFCLIELPLMIAHAAHKAEMPAFFFPAQELAGIVIGVMATLLAIWAALTVAITGQGMPLPINAVRRYVVGGPYAWVRNPIIVAILLQCLAVTLYTGFIPLQIFGMVGAALWALVVYPMEKREFERSFGREYEAHRRGVSVWVPNLRRWTPPPGTRPISLEDIPAPRDRRRASR